jgi:hypothetical protein
MHAALAYDRGSFVVVAARTKKIVRELSLRFRQRRPYSKCLDFELISHADAYSEDSMSVYLRRMMNSVVNIEWWILQSFDEAFGRLYKLHLALCRDSARGVEAEDLLTETLRKMLSLLADRHTYLQKVYYKDMQSRMENYIHQLDVLFMTTTQLKKVNSSCVSWVQYIRRDCPRLLIQDEIEDTEMPDIAASAWTFDGLNIYGDWPQGRNTDQKNLSMSAGWFQHNAMAESMTQSVLLEEHRYGERVASLIRELFPEECSHVHASVDSPQSMSVPHLFHCDTEWRTNTLSEEVLENKEVYGDLVVCLAFEAVNAFKMYLISREEKQPSIAILWNLLRPLMCLQMYLHTSFPLMCLDVVGRLECIQYFSTYLPFSFGPESMHTPVTLTELFALDAWMLAGWITFGAVQSARGVTKNIVFLVIVLRREDDEVYAGDMTQSCNLYIGLSRGRDVLHIFLRDLRPALQASPSCNVEGPRRERNNEPGSFIPKAAVRYRGKGELRLCQLYTYLEQQVWTAYEAGAQGMRDAYARYSGSQNWRFDTALFDEKYCTRLVGRRYPASELLKHVVAVLDAAEMYFRLYAPFGPSEVESSRAAEYKTCDLFPNPKSVEALRDKNTALMWAQLANLPEVAELPQRTNALPSFDKYLNSGQTALEADGDGGEDITVYLEHERRRIREDIIEHWGRLAIDAITVQPSTPERVTVAIPFAVGLQMSHEDLNFVIALMGEFATTSLCSYYNRQTAVRLEIVRPKKNEFEIEGERFCYQQCFSDRPGFNIVLGEEQRPVVHASRAMGLEHQHEQQRVVLARCTSYVAAAVWVHASQRS